MSATFACDHCGEPMSRPRQPIADRVVELGAYDVKVRFDVTEHESLEWPDLCSKCQKQIVADAAKEIAK